MIFIDSFSGGVARLTAKQKKNKIAVLHALSNDPNVSTWDMSEGKLWVAIKELISDGYIKEIEKPYPWHKFVVTEAGKKLLEAK
jgi:DNA-binding PadR family transcriptional regulator